MNIYTIDIRMIDYTMVIHGHIDLQIDIDFTDGSCNADNKGIMMKVLYETPPFA